MITELPYNVGAEQVIEKIKELHDAKKITGVSAVTDLSDGEQRDPSGHRGEERLQPRRGPG